ncbi:MAG: TRAP transporter small permease [Desulfobulbaceae bacterium]|jgi:TRAP-type C4-dicarboxylate transport system permease small subunit|nr:TRAP transporter small permease [Desulfobulbaceae bacterium]MDY0351265.1 TRAP transporter small permease [Desulfobulbaceae bacterium]
MTRLEKNIIATAEKANWIAAAALILMMLLTTLDVVLRLFKNSIPGTYEIIGLLGAVVASFALGYTSVEKGHIAVDFLVMRFSPRVQALAGAVNALVAAVLFGLITWQSLLYAVDLMKKGQVTLTVQLPIYPFVFGIAAGCGLLALVLAVEFLHDIRTYRDLRRS